MTNSNLGPTSHRLAAIRRTDHQGHPRSTISILFKRAYATFYLWLIIILALYLTVSEIRPLIAWNLKIAAKPLQI